jgi:hypothetical protein
LTHTILKIAKERKRLKPLLRNLRTSTKKIKRTRSLKTTKKQATKNSARCVKQKQGSALRHNMNRKADSNLMMIAKKTGRTKKKVMKMALIKTRMMTMKVTIISDMLFVYLYSL